MLTHLRESGIPVLPSSAAAGQDTTYARLGAFRNAADARALGAHIAETWGLTWEWVHVEKDEPVSAELVAASHAFLYGMDTRKGRGRND